jgi:hypothetical protein
MTNRHLYRGVPLATLSVVAQLGCGGDLSLPTDSGAGVDLSIIEGDGQTGTVGQELPKPLVVLVEAGGAPIEGHRVAFVVRSDGVAGEIDPDTAVTGPDGRAVAHWVLGPEAGTYEVEAKLVVSEPAPAPTAVFEVSAIAGDPDSVRAVSPVSQPGRIGQPTADDPTVLVVDQFGNRVGGAVVDWEVIAGRGSVSSPQSTTGADGQTSVIWTLGVGVGVQKLTARVDGAHGSPVAFTATVLF